jgi:polyisoprenoid-binding protein YceI
MSWKRSSHLWMKALGITGLDAAITDAGLRFDHAGFVTVVRGAFQDHFGA